MLSNEIAPSSSTDLATRGKILRNENGRTVFHVIDTNYELHLESGEDLSSLIGQKVVGRVRVKARKVYGVPSGGNFVQPVLGTPRIIQGRVLNVDQHAITVKAGAIFIVELPTGPDAIDLHHGAIGVASLVNIVALPGASFELVRTNR
jgi:hypothetical protein